MKDPEPGGLGGRLRPNPPGRQAEQPRRPRQRQPAQEASSRPAVSLLGTHGNRLSLTAIVRKGA